MRLVRRQEPEAVFRLLKDFVVEINPDVRVEPAGSLHPYMGEYHGAYPQAARRAIQFGFGVEPASVWLA